jgi:hypothetical protein
MGEPYQHLFKIHLICPAAQPSQNPEAILLPNEHNDRYNWRYITLRVIWPAFFCDIWRIHQRDHSATGSSLAVAGALPPRDSICSKSENCEVRHIACKFLRQIICKAISVQKMRANILQSHIWAMSISDLIKSVIEKGHEITGLGPPLCLG